jgi:membrane fusion protein, multidrug efflux system
MIRQIKPSFLFSSMGINKIMNQKICLSGQFQKAGLLQMPGKLAACVLVLAILVCSCSKKPQQNQQPRPGGQMGAVPVKTEQVKLQTAAIELNGFGTVESCASVEIKSQITGILTAAHFTEGQIVKKGDLLLSIDSRQQQAALNSAKAVLERDLAQLKNAENDANRQTDLFNKGIASQDTYDNIITAAEVLRSTVKADMASVENATLQLDYCSIRSPIDGITGILLVQPGNLVTANSTAIVTIKQLNPIYVTFRVPEQYLPDIQKYMSRGKLDVSVYKNEPNNPIQGTLTFVDNAVDVATRTIRLRATFTNTQQRLWPGQYVNQTLTLAREPNSIVISSVAVQTSQDNQFVYVVKPDKTVEARPVTIIRAANNQSVVNGLKPDETIVIDGQLRLVPGSRVEIKNTTQK